MSIEASFSPAAFPALRSGALEAVELRSRASGHAAGYAAGLREAAEEIAERAARQQEEAAAAIAEGELRVQRAVAALRAATVALERRTVPVLAQAQDAIAATAIELAEAIVGRELSDADTAAASALHRALADVVLELVHRVRLNPDDLAALDAEVIAAAGITLIPDPSLDRGDAITEFEDGYLDARVSSALERARAAILEVGP